MRYFWLVIVAATSVLAGIGIGKWIDSKYIPSKSLSPAKPIAPRGDLRIRPGYVEIPDFKISKCSGQQSGIIRIRLTDVLKNLHMQKQLARDVTLWRGGDIVNEVKFATAPLEALQNPLLSTPFPTRLDLTTAVRLADGDRLVEPNLVATTNTAANVITKLGKFVIVRIVLEKDDGVMADSAGNQRNVEPIEFLRPLQGQRDDSGFAVMRSANSNRDMFCARYPIKTETVAGRDLEYVDFGVQSTGTNTVELGSFGIGLMVHDPEGAFVTPIILDPVVKNEG